MLFRSGSIADAVNEGVRQGYSEGYLRKSVVRDPLNRVNTGDNTPEMLYYDLVPGYAIRITVAPKGFGSENMSQLKMLKPSDGVEGAKEFIVRVVEEAGPNPCPPIVVGVGIGGTFDKCALLAKKALMRSTDERKNIHSLVQRRSLTQTSYHFIHPCSIACEQFADKTE